MVASMKEIQMRLVPSGLENPSVVSEEPLMSNADCTESVRVPQNTKVKATTMSSIHDQRQADQGDRRVEGAQRPGP